MVAFLFLPLLEELARGGLMGFVGGADSLCAFEMLISS